MPESFRDNEARSRFELDVDGAIAFVTYRKADGAITLVHTEVPPELGGRGIGSKLGRATLDAVRAQGQKLIVECDFIRNFMGKNPGYNDLLAEGESAQSVPLASYRAGCFCGAKTCPTSITSARVLKGTRSLGAERLRVASSFQ